MPQRLEYIDLAKGLCMLMIVMVHCGIYDSWIMFGYTLWLPCFLFISGMFFKEIEWKVFLKKRVNTLLVPFLFFYILAYIVFYALALFAPSLKIGISTGVLDIFTQRQQFNGPIWYLLSLFWTYLIYYGICKIAHNIWIRTFIVLICGTAGMVLGKMHIFLPCFIDVSLTSMPFFFVGHLLAKHIKETNEKDRFKYLLTAIVLITAYALIIQNIRQPIIQFHQNRIFGNYYLSVVLSLLFVFAFLAACKAIVKIPVINYFGKYSIIPLCVHHMIYRPLYVIFIKYGLPCNEYLVATLTILLSLACIPLCRRYIPQFTAQRRNCQTGIL